MASSPKLLELTVSTRLARTSKALQIADSTEIPTMLEELPAIEADLEAAHLDLVLKQAAVRAASSALEERENDIIQQVINDNAKDSQASIDRKVKLAKHDDEQYAKRAEHLAELRNDLGEAEVDYEANRRKHRGTCARLNAAGSYLNWLAVNKEAQTMNRILGADLP